MAGAEQFVSIKGKLTKVPCVEVGGKPVVVTGKWLRMAAVMDEPLVEGKIVEDPVAFTEQMRKSAVRADIFSYAQKLPEITPLYNYNFEWDNLAAVPITTYNDWWEKRLPQESRKNVRRAGKRGVVVRTVAFDDEFVKGIQGIYNETPVRQGRRFWHFGKDFETVKRENATYLDRSAFIGAYLGEELIGFIKIVFVDRNATIMQIITKNQHHDKRPMNALLASAVELCVSRGMSYLLYGKYVYGKKEGSQMTEFKRRNGFEEIKFPRYFLPLTIRGKLAVRSGLHLGVRNLIPVPVINLLLNLRLQLYRNLYRSRQTSGDSAQEARENA
jgi:hypothetical protein